MEIFDFSKQSTNRTSFSIVLTSIVIMINSVATVRRTLYSSKVVLRSLSLKPTVSFASIDPWAVSQNQPHSVLNFG